MSRYLAAANAKRQALARQLAEATSGLGLPWGAGDNGDSADAGDADDVDALIQASMAELGADTLPSGDLEDELHGLEIEGGPEDDDEVAKELERRREAAAARRRNADKIAHSKEKKGGGMTATMNSLNELALKRARMMVIKRFQTPLDLDDSSSVSYQMQKQSVAAAAQLNGAVQTKLDALKRAADLMDESTAKLTRLSETIHEIDQRIMLTNTVISNYEYLRRVHNVRDNLSRVVSNLDFFTKVPELVATLLNTLETDPTQIKDVFLESIKLESLHSALIKELKTNKGRRQSVAAIEEAGEWHHDGMTRPGRSSSMYSSTDDGQRRIIAAIEEHLSVVPELSRRIRDQLWSVLGSYDQIVDTAQKSPQTLVTTFEIVEMHQEYMDRRIEQAQMSGELEGMDPDFIATSLGYEAISDECQSRIRSAFENQVEGKLLAASDAAASGGGAVSNTLAVTKAATQLVHDIVYFKHEVDPCFPHKYNALETFLDVFEEKWMPEAQSMMRGIGDLSTQETLRLIDWFHFYQLQVQELETGLRPSTEKFEEFSMELMDEYSNKVKSEIMRQFGEIRYKFWEAVRSDNPEVIRHTDGSWVTTAPTDMHRSINMSLQIGLEKLPPEMMHKPVLIALQCLQDYMRETYDLFEIDKKADEGAGDSSTEAEEIRLQADQMKKMSPDLMCAMVNDCTHSADDFQQLFETYISKVTQPEMQSALREQLDGVVNFYTDLAVCAVNFLSRCVISVELSESFKAIFTEKWENGDDPVVAAIADTISQVLDHSKDHLDQFFYRKLANLLLSATVECYLSSFLQAGGNNREGYRFDNDVHAAIRVSEDYTSLKDMFTKYEEDLKYGGLRGNPGSTKTPLEDVIEPIAALQSVLQVGEFNFCEDAVKVLHEKYPGDGLEIVRCAITYRPEGSMRPAEKRAFERAAAEFCQRLDNVKNIEKGLAPPVSVQEEATPAKQGFFSRVFGYGGKG